MGYVGNQQAEGFVQRPTKQDLTGATGTSLTLTHAVSKEEDIDLYINNVKQEPTTAYTVADTAVTLTGSVVATDDIYVVYNSLALQTVVPPDGSVSTAKLASGAVTSAKLVYPLTTFSSTGIDDNATSTAMTLDSSGNVGIGTTSVGEKLTVSGSGYQAISLFSGSDNIRMYANGSDLGLQSVTSGNPIIFQTNGGSGATERMRIDSSGNLLVGGTVTQPQNLTGTSSQFAYNPSLGVLSVSRSSGQPFILNRTTTDGVIAQFRRNGSNVGSVDVTTSGTTYNTTSDLRLKTDIEPIDHATDMLMAMNPVLHRWKADPDADAVVGFIAQEMQEIVPEAVSGSADSDEMMAMDYGRITPVLVAALQDAHKKIEQLEQRIADMENN